MRTMVVTSSFISLLSTIAGCGDGSASRELAFVPPTTEVDLGVVCPESWLTPPAVDASIALPADGGSVLLHALASGTQNYVCAASDSGGGGAPTYAWTLVAPAARLADCAGNTIGMHTAAGSATMPKWISADGSSVIGRKVTAFTPDATAIPWLLLAATAHDGAGIMSRVAYVQRLDTAGGVASGPCDASNVGALQNVPYTSDYYFSGK